MSSAPSTPPPPLPTSSGLSAPATQSWERWSWRPTAAGRTPGCRPRRCRFGTSRDVTAQTRAENTLAEQALQLIAQNERLRELDRLKDEFIGMFSHELRTPLASILGYAEILMEDGLSGPEADHCVEVIDRNAKRLLRLAGDLQLLAQINSGHM